MARGDFGFNGQIGNRSYGSRRVRIMSIGYNLDIVASADNEARSRRAFYPVATEGSSFRVDLGFVSWEDREAFNRWMSRFMVSVSEGSAKIGTLTVRCPSRNFIRVGVPQGNLEYGEGIKDVAYAVRLTFTAATHPVDVSVGQRMTGIAYFKGPRDNAQAKFFYPGGKQIKGAESLEGTLFDDTPDGPTFTPTVTADDNLDHHHVDSPGV